MSENIATIQEFLTRAELRLSRQDTIFQILEIDEQGQAVVIVNPHYGRPNRGSTKLTDKEIVSLAACCFAPK